MANVYELQEMETFLSISNRVSIGEWSRDRAPLYRDWVDAIAGVVNDTINVPLEILKLQYSIAVGKATGIGLDHIGEKVGYPRPLFTSQAQVFGFSDEDTGFDQAPFYDEELENVTESPISDPYYRSLLRARGHQLLSSGSIPDLTAITSEVFRVNNVNTSAWRTVGPKQVSFTAYTNDYQIYQLVRSTGLLDVPAGVRRLVLFNEWMLPIGQSETMRILVRANSPTSLVSSSADIIAAPDQNINPNTDNGIASVDWNNITDTLTITCEGSDNELVEWLGNNLLSCIVARIPDGITPPAVSDGLLIDESQSITAPTEQSIAAVFASSSVFPVAAGDRVLIVLANPDTVGRVSSPGRPADGIWVPS